MYIYTRILSATIKRIGTYTNDVGVKRYFAPYDTTDCSAFHAPAILKHLKFAHFSVKNGYFSVFLRVKRSRNPLASKLASDFLTFWPWYPNIKLIYTPIIKFQIVSCLIRELQIAKILQKCYSIFVKLNV